MINLRILFFCWLACVIQNLTVADFKPALFHSSQPSGFYSVNTGSNNTGLILAFGDLNGDKYTDYVSTDDPTSNIISFNYWNQRQSAFTSNILSLNSTNFVQIAQIMICDVDGDSLPQLVITYNLTNNRYSSEIYDVICSTKCQIKIQNIDFQLMTNMTSVPFLVDITGSGKISFFILGLTSRTVLQYDSAHNLKATQWSTLLFNPSSNYNIVSQHFASIIDINGDCNSDLVIVSNDNNKLNTIIEFYVKINNNLYSQLPALNPNKNITWLNFADIDANGAIDLAFVALQNGIYSLYILLNSNKPSQICKAGSFPYSLSNLIKIRFPSNYNLISNSNIKFADFNFDGLPDILGIFSINNFKKVSILVNKGANYFEVFDAANIQQISSIDNPVQACIFDFTQNGKIDLIVINKVPKQDGTSAFVRSSIVNNIIQDTLFIKILPLLVTSSQDFESSNINSAIGITVSWIITNLDGDKTISILNQRYQWNYGSLQLPFVTVGLGRTNNYIQDLTVGYPGYGQIQTWTPIIPNSQLMVKRTPQSDWQLQTLLKDNSRVYDVIYISIICLFLLGLVVFYLNWRENQEDKRDHYNFIQMIR